MISVVFISMVSITIEVKFDPYIFDALMRDLVGHSRSSAAYLVYLQLYRHTLAIGRSSAAISHSVMADVTGLSKRGVQAAVAHLAGRQLVQIERSGPTAVPTYHVQTPW